MEFLTIKDEMDYCTNRYYLKKEIEDIFLAENYVQFEPSLFERYDSFTSVNRRIKKESMVKVIDGSGKVLILRPDITTNIIKSLVPRFEEGTKLKLFYNTSIYRTKSEAKIKDFKQMGIEYLGEDTSIADKEVILTAIKVLNKYKNDFIFELGSSTYLDALLKEIPNKENVEEIKNLIYRKSKSELIKHLDLIKLDKHIHDVLLNILDFQGNIDSVIDKAEKYYLNEKMKESLAELKDLINSVKDTEYNNNIYLDLSMISELDYYDGAIFKGYYPDSNLEIISGGRYDTLTALFGKRISAVGFSINLDELMRVVSGGGKKQWII